MNDAEIWTNTTGKALVPPTPQVYTHDLDGNLTADGLWTRTWNAENRVLTVESVSSLPADAKKREAWTYLPDGRWIERIVSTNNGSAYYPALTNRYVWDGQVLLAVLDHANGLVMSFMRGPDLSGSVQGAGGVGGVLAVNHNANSQPSTHFVSYDGNGNVVGLSDAATGANTARFEYGPFGELQRATGPMATAMPLRFSTMYSDDVTGDVKYLFRDYRVEEGRWTSRDPIGCRGGLNLYLFVRNACLHKFDVLGLVTGRFGPQVITEADASISDFSTDFSPRVSHVCGGSSEPKDGVVGKSCAYLRFFWFVSVNTKLPPPDSLRWKQSNLRFADDQINQAWDSDPSYQGRRAAVLAHEGKHVADMQASYNSNKELMEGYEAWFNSKQLCERIAAMVKRWVLQRHADDARASQERWD